MNAAERFSAETRRMEQTTRDALSLRSKEEIQALEIQIEKWQDRQKTAEGDEILDVLRWVLKIDDSTVDQFLSNQDMAE